MKKFIHYSLMLLSCSSLFSSQPTQTIEDNDGKKLETLYKELQKGTQTLVEKSNNIENTSCSLQSLEEACADSKAQEKRFNDFKTHYQTLEKSGRLTSQGKLEGKNFLDNYTPLLHAQVSMISKLVQERRDLNTKMGPEKAALILKGEQISYESTDLQVQAHNLHSIAATSLRTGCTPEVSAAVLISSLALMKKSVELEKKQTQFKSDTESFLNKSNLSQFESHNSK